MDTLHHDVNASLLGEGGDAFGNQAVLGALNSLQQKIKRLEQERDYYNDAAHKARAHVEAFKLESEQLRGQERREQDERMRLREDDVRRLKEDRPRIELELQHVHDKALHTERLLDAERKDFQHRLKDATTERDECKEQMLAMKSRLAHLESQVSVEAKLKEVAVEERERAKESVKELVVFNETLFARLQEMEGGGGGGGGGGGVVVAGGRQKGGGGGGVGQTRRTTQRSSSHCRRSVARSSSAGVFVCFVLLKWMVVTSALGLGFFVL